MQRGKPPRRREEYTGRTPTPPGIQTYLGKEEKRKEKWYFLINLAGGPDGRGVGSRILKTPMERLPNMRARHVQRFPSKKEVFAKNKQKEREGGWVWRQARVKNKGKR